MTLKKKMAIAAIAVLYLQYGFAQVRNWIELEKEIYKILNDHHVPGAQVALISKDSPIWTGAFGQANVKKNVPVTENTLFTIGSISKTFLAAAAMIAHEQGKLNIDDPLEKLVPSFGYKNKWDGPVRLIHLLEHTSGFDEAHFNLFPQVNSSTTFSEVLNKSMKSMETRWEPGKYFEYNTLGYITAAYVLEENVETSFEQFITKNLLLPLEMNGATYHPRDSTTFNFSKGYTGNNMEEVPFPDIPQWPAGALTTNIGALTNFIRMMLNDGRFKEKQILSPDAVRQMETPETSLQAKAGVTFGYGKGIWTKNENGHLYYGHSGRYGGFLSEFGYSREHNSGYIILINSVSGGKAIKEIKAFLLSSNDQPPHDQVNQFSEIEPSQLKDVSGCYQPITSVPQLGKIGYFVYRLIDMPIIGKENGHWYQSNMLGDKQVRLHVRDFLFKDSTDPIASAAFVDVEGNGWQWLAKDGAYRRIPMWWGYLQFYTAVICLLLIAIGFLSLLVWIPSRLIRKKRESIGLQLFTFLALGSFFGMIGSIALFYDPTRMYSLGAIFFFVFGWLFFIISFLSLAQIMLVSFKKREINSWVKYHVLVTSLACCITASYLFYWDIIGLMLWDY